MGSESAGEITELGENKGQIDGARPDEVQAGAPGRGFDAQRDPMAQPKELAIKPMSQPAFGSWARGLPLNPWWENGNDKQDLWEEETSGREDGARDSQWKSRRAKEISNANRPEKESPDPARSESARLRRRRLLFG